MYEDQRFKITRATANKVGARQTWSEITFNRRARVKNIAYAYAVNAHVKLGFLLCKKSL